MVTVITRMLISMLSLTMLISMLLLSMLMIFISLVAMVMAFIINHAPILYLNNTGWSGALNCACFQC